MLKEFGDEINRLKALLEQRAKGKVPKTIVPKEPKPKKEKVC